jgi:hypothetical protein
MKTLNFACAVTVATLMVSYWSNSAHGYTAKGTSKISSVNIEVVKAKKLGLSESKSAAKTKKEFGELKKKSPLKFDELMADNLGNPSEIQGYLYEVRDGIDKVEQAKILAKSKLFEAVKERWSDVKNTTLNEDTAEKFEDFSSPLKIELEKIEYRSQTRSNTFVFVVSDWATALVSSDLRSVDWVLRINGMYDANKLQAGMEAVTVPDPDAAPAAGSGSAIKSDFESEYQDFEY